MKIEVVSRRKPVDEHIVRGSVSDLDGKGVGRLVLVAEDDDERKFITSIYRLLGPPRPQNLEQILLDQGAAEHIRRWLSVAQSRINLEAQEWRESPKEQST